jgi:hypothetical protein
VHGSSDAPSSAREIRILFPLGELRSQPTCLYLSMGGLS